MDLTRRTVLSSLAMAAGALAAPPAFELEETTVAGLQKRMSEGSLTAQALTERYLARIEAIDKRGPAINAVAIARAARCTAFRLLIKDNIDTADARNFDGSR